MEQIIRRLLQRLFPELDNRTHLPRWGKVVRIPSPPTAGQLSTDEEPGYAVDVQLLDAQGQPDGPVYESVPLPVSMAGNQRGLFGFPPVGTRVLVQWVYGLPSHPVVTGVYALDRHLPAVGEVETLLQHSSATYLRTNSSEDVDLRARNRMRLGNGDVDLVERVERLARILESHTHPMTSPCTQGAAIGAVAADVGKLKT